MNEQDYKILNSKIKEDLERNLDSGRLSHTINVVNESIRLAKENNGSVEKAEFIALVHDMFREPNNKDNALIHGKLAAKYVQDEYGIDDEEVLNSISYHTTGRNGMGIQEKIIFLADAIEKDRDYDGVNIIRKESEKGLNYGVRASLINTINHLKDVGRDIGSDTPEALRFIEEEINNSEK